MKNDKKKFQAKAKAAALKESAPQWMLPLVLVITFIVFSPTLKNEMIGTWDDGLYIADNHLTAKLSSENVKAIFTTPVGNNYNPLSNIKIRILHPTILNLLSKSNKLH